MTTSKKTKEARASAGVHDEALLAGYTQLLLTARHTLEALRVAALAHAAECFENAAERLRPKDAETARLASAELLTTVQRLDEDAQRCREAARTALGHVTG